MTSVDEHKSPQTDEVVTPEHQTFVSEILALCKPRVIELLITTALPAMFLAQGGYPDAIKIFGVLVGGSLAAGSSNAINSILEKDTDAHMHRTRHRPMAQRRLSVRTAWTVVITAQIVSIVLLVVTCNVLSALMTLCASFVYVVVYTIWLKPRTDQNIVIGGAAGALPVIIGYSAVTATIDWQAWVMFALVFLWTPAHFWALALFHEDDYRRGGFPMMPITRGKEMTLRWMLFYTVATVGASIVLAADESMSMIYYVTAALTGAWFIFEAIRLNLAHGELHRSRYIRFFHISNGYLALLFISIAVDSVVR